MGRIQTVDFSKVTLEEIEAIFNNPPHRYNTMSPMLNKMIGGWKENSFNLLVSSSGTGKSMMCFSNIAHGFASKLYVDGKWVDNKGLNENKVLYIGTHMDLHDKCLHQIACCIGGLDYNRFLEGEFTEEEDARYYEALKIFCNDGKIYLKDCKDYDSNILKAMVESDDFKTVFIDCLEVAPSLGAFDLEMLARFCKHTLAKSMNRAIIATAQANTSLERKKLSEISSDYIDVSNCLHHKADTLLFLVKGSQEDSIRLAKANPDKTFPELEPERIRKILLRDKVKNCYAPSGTCLWGYFDNTLRWHDLFVTDSDYKLVNLDDVI